MSMKKRILVNVYYAAAAVYAVIGAMLLDWSFSMTPPTSGTPTSEVTRIMIMDSFYVVEGVLLFCAIFFTVRNRLVGETLFKIIFIGGLSLVFGSAIIVFILSKLVNYPAAYLRDFPVNAILFIPIIMLFVNRKLIRGN